MQTLCPCKKTPNKQENKQRNKTPQNPQQQQKNPPPKYCTDLLVNFWEAENIWKVSEAETSLVTHSGFLHSAVLHQG